MSSLFQENWEALRKNYVVKYDKYSYYVCLAQYVKKFDNFHQAPDIYLLTTNYCITEE